MQLDPTTRARLTSLRRWLLVVAASALAWVVVLHLTGGFTLTLGTLRIRSHNVRTPLLVAMLGLLGIFVVSKLTGEAPSWPGLQARTRWAFASALVWIDSRVSRVLPVRTSELWRHARATLPAATLVALVIAAIVVDLHQLFGAAPLWLDEEMIALNIRDRTFSELGGRLWLEQSAPYGWLVVQRAVLLTLGASEPALRLVPTLFGIATYVAALWIARRWLTWLAGVALVLLCVFGHWLSHFRVEVKHYSADVCSALLLPALAVWASEGPTPAARQRRTIVWWAIAAAALWLANGAIFVAPVGALFLLAAMHRRDGARAALKHAALGVIWLASFALHYLISLQHTAYLRNYWAAEFPPRGGGPLETIRWFAGRLDRLAGDVAGSDAGVLFWVLAALGFVSSARPALAVVYAGVVLSGFVLATLRVVPMFDRFALWMAPALYAGIALLLDRAVRSARDAWRAGDWLRGGSNIALACAVILVCAGMLQRGIGRLHMVPPTSKQGSDDRTGVTWLMSHRQQGDALMSTPLGLPAVWWYGGVSIAGEFESRQANQPMYEVAARPDGTGCGLRDALKSHPRVLVYVGFPDMAKGFDELLFKELDRIGTITAYREIAMLSRSAVVDLRVDGPNDPSFTGREPRPSIDGCVGVAPARRR